MDDLRSRLVKRVQLSTDGHSMYSYAVEGAFGGDVDYADHQGLWCDTEPFGTLHPCLVQGHKEGQRRGRS